MFFFRIGGTGLFPTAVTRFEKSQWPALSFVGYRTDEMKQPAFN
jgi:hypothetical protein